MCHASTCHLTVHLDIYRKYFNNSGRKDNFEHMLSGADAVMLQMNVTYIIHFVYVCIRFTVLEYLAVAVHG